MGNQSSANVGDLSFDIRSPPTPFNVVVPGGLKPGKVMFLEGVAKSGKHSKDDRFNVNFDANEHDCAFHYDVRFFKDDNAIVMNSRHDKTWEKKEERIQNTFVHDKPFRIDVQIQSEGLVISHDGGLPYNFQHRKKLTLERVTKIAIDGNIHIDRIFYGYPQQAQQPPHGGAGGQTPGFTSPSHTGAGAGGQAVPVPGGMNPGRQIVIQATPTANADRFTVDLNGQPGNIALHINPRFSENEVVRNALQSGSWGAEERHGPGFPFYPNQPFQLQVLCDHAGYKIAVNGQHFAEFNHRLDMASVQSVTVGGDVNVVDVKVF